MNPIRLEVSVDNQQLHVLQGDKLLKSYPVSTAAKGVGTQANSHRTPTGNFRIAEKFGHNSPPHTLFKERKESTIWDAQPSDDDHILSRILWLDGTDPHNINTRNRFIYIHGTNHQQQIGTPCSGGCVRMSPNDVADLFELAEVGTEVVIIPPLKKRRKLIFFDCDSTLSSIEGIDELARARGPEVFTKVEALTHAAMNGEIPIQEVFPRRMEIINPDLALCDQVARQYVETITEGTEALISDLKSRDWTPIILSGGFAPLIEPLARHLGISHIEAVPMSHHPDGSYAGYDSDYPTTRNGGKPEIIREWKQAMLPKQVIMVGDGISDLETSREVDLFVGYGGVIARESVRQQSKCWLESFNNFPDQVYPLIEAAAES